MPSEAGILRGAAGPAGFGWREEIVRFAGSGGSGSGWLPDGTRLALLTDSPEGYAELPKIPKAGGSTRTKPTTTPAGGGRPALGGPRETPQKAQDFITADQWKKYCEAFA